MTNVLSSVNFIKHHEIIQTPRMCSNGHEIALKLENCKHKYASRTEKYVDTWLFRSKLPLLL